MCRRGEGGNPKPRNDNDRYLCFDIGSLCSDSRDFYSKLYPHPRLAGTCNYNASEDTRDSTVSAADGGDVWRVIAG